jgi:hypothetical protein
MLQNGFTALHWAAYHGHSATAAELVRLGAYAQLDAKTSLVRAARRCAPGAALLREPERCAAS